MTALFISLHRDRSRSVLIVAVVFAVTAVNGERVPCRILQQATAECWPAQPLLILIRRKIAHRKRLRLCDGCYCPWRKVRVLI